MEKAIRKIVLCSDYGESKCIAEIRANQIERIIIDDISNSLLYEDDEMDYIKTTPYFYLSLFKDKLDKKALYNLKTTKNLSSIEIHYNNDDDEIDIIDLPFITAKGDRYCEVNCLQETYDFYDKESKKNKFEIIVKEY